MSVDRDPAMQRLRTALGSSDLRPVRRRTTPAPGPGARQMLITALHADYVVARLYNDDVDPPVTGTTDYRIAKPRRARRYSGAPTTGGWDGQTIDGISYVYSDGQHRQATIVAGGATEDQVIVPLYRLGSVIHVERVDHTGVLVGGVALNLIDQNLDGRRFARQTGT